MKIVLFQTILMRWTRHAEHGWRRRDKLILQWTPSYGRASAGRPTKTFLSQLCMNIGCSLEDPPEVIDDRDEWWWWYMCVCVCVYIYIYIYIYTGCCRKPLELCYSIYFSVFLVYYDHITCTIIALLTHFTQTLYCTHNNHKALAHSLHLTYTLHSPIKS